MPGEGRGLSSRLTQDVVRDLEIGQPSNSENVFKSCRRRYTRKRTSRIRRHRLHLSPSLGRRSMSSQLASTRPLARFSLRWSRDEISWLAPPIRTRADPARFRYAGLKLLNHLSWNGAFGRARTGIADQPRSSDLLDETMHLAATPVSVPDRLRRDANARGCSYRSGFRRYKPVSASGRSLSAATATCLLRMPTCSAHG